MEADETKSDDSADHHGSRVKGGETAMSRITKEINKITGTIIGVSGKLILYAIVILLLFEGVSKGYAFGHDIFYARAMEAEPGTEKVVTISAEDSVSDAAQLLARQGLIDNQFAFQVQKLFYDYEIVPGTYTLNTSMTSKEILQTMDEASKAESEEAEEESGQ